MGRTGVSRTSAHGSGPGAEAGSLCGPLRPVEVPGASSFTAGEPDGYTDTLSSAPLLPAPGGS